MITLLASMVLASPCCCFPSPVGNIQETCGMSSGGVVSGDVVHCADATSDVRPQSCSFNGANSWPQATGGNTAARPTFVSEGMGSRTIAIDAFGNCAGDTLNTDYLLGEGPTVVTLTEGIDWTAAASNSATAQSLRDAINASAAGAAMGAFCSDATCTTPTIYLLPGSSTLKITLSESDATCSTVTEGADGEVWIDGILNPLDPILVVDGTAAAPSVALSSDADGTGTGMYRLGADKLGFSLNGNLKIGMSGDLLLFGGETNAFPAWKRNGTQLQARLADDSGYASLRSGSMTLDSTSTFSWAFRSSITSPQDGYIALFNSAQNDFGLLQLGGTSNAFPAIKRNGAAIDVRLANDSGYANLTGAGLIGTSFVRASSAVYFHWFGRSRLYSDTDGNIRLNDDASTDFGLLQFGGTGNTYPAWKRSSTTLVARLADDSANTDITVSAVNVSPSYTRHIEMQAGVALLGPTAPTGTTINTVCRGLEFDADAEEAFLTHEVPTDWDESSDMYLDIWWTNDPGSAIGAGQTVKWDAQYSVKAEGDDLTAGVSTTETVTYTQSGAGTDGELFKSRITFDYQDANNPLVVGEGVCIQFTRDVSGDTYGSGGVVLRWELVYSSDALPQH